MIIKTRQVLIYMDTLSTKTYRSKKLLHININASVQFKIQRRQYRRMALFSWVPNFVYEQNRHIYGVQNSWPFSLIFHTENR